MLIDLVLPITTQWITSVPKSTHNSHIIFHSWWIVTKRHRISTSVISALSYWAGIIRRLFTMVYRSQPISIQYISVLLYSNWLRAVYHGKQSSYDSTSGANLLTTEMGEYQGCQSKVGRVVQSCTADPSQPADHRNVPTAMAPGKTTMSCKNFPEISTKVCWALPEEMELLGCYINFIKNQIFG